MSIVRDQMEKDMNLRNLSPSTQRIYLSYVRRFENYYDKPATEMGEKEVRDFLVYMQEKRGLSPKTMKGCVAAMKFLYANTLRRGDVVQPWFMPRVVAKLPQILSYSEVEKLFNTVESIVYRAIIMTTYGAGLRISETCNLQVSDIDSEKMLIHIRKGKGGRERYAMLSTRLLLVLRSYWKHVRPPNQTVFVSWKKSQHGIEPKLSAKCASQSGSSEWNQ